MPLRIAAAGCDSRPTFQLQRREAEGIANEMETSLLETAGSSNRYTREPEAIFGGAANDLPDVCDRATLDDLRAEGDGLLSELVGIFQSELSRGLGQLSHALAARDCSAVARIAHTLKGTAGNFGARHMYDMAARIDQTARAGHTEQAAAIFEDFRCECERVRRYLAAEVKL